MKFSMLLMVTLVTSGIVPAQSNPSWWKYTPPEATALVGIQWKALRTSFFASAIASELTPGGVLGFPDIEMLRTPEQILIGSPSMLAIEYGAFPVAELREQAAKAGLARAAFKSTELWLSSDPAVLSVAYISEKIVLAGSRRTLEDAIARITNPKAASYSPLLARAARYSKEDLWVVASALPDPVASRFLPLEIQATAFEGSVSLWDGLHLVAAVERTTPMQALDFADSLAEGLASRPAMADGTEISTRERSVLIRMDLDEEQLASSLRAPRQPITLAQDQHEAELAVAAPAKPQPRAFVPPPATAPAPPRSAATTVAAEVPEAEVTEVIPVGSPQVNLPPAPPRPRVIKIIGLESGPREIPLGN